MHTVNIYSTKGRVRNCVGKQAVKWWHHPTNMCQTNHNYAESMFRLHIVIIHMAVWLQVCYTVSGRTTPLIIRDYPVVLFIGLWPHSFIKSCTCTAFVWYLLYWVLCAVMPLSHYINAITYRSYVFFLIHSW